MVELHYEDVAMVPDISSEFLLSWYSEVVTKESKELGDVNIILCSDEFLLDLNRSHLDHDYYTDIITFDYTVDNLVSGDLFVSIDRVAENAVDFGVSFRDEIHRVCVHGLLHLCGYGDKSEAEEILMRSKENEMLDMREFHVKHLRVD